MRVSTPHLHEVVGVDEEREDGEGQREREELAGRREPIRGGFDPGGERARTPSLGARHPLVDADSRPVGRLRLTHQTFFTSGLPRMPCGRTSMNTIRIMKTTRSLKALPSRPRVRSSM